MTLPEHTTPAALSAGTRTPLWMRATLLVSLALNLAVVGVVAGTLAGRGAPERDAAPRDMASSLYLRALPDEQRAKLGDSLRREVRQFRADREGLRAELTSTLDVLRADPFDPAAFTARIARQRQAMSERVSAGDRLLIERLAEMTPAERRAYADRLEQTFERIARWRRD